MRRLPGLMLGCLLALLSPGSADALESPPVTSARATATLVSETDAIDPGQPFRVALRLRMAPGWHSYWQNPGDAGVAPELQFSLPAGVTAGELSWPAPRTQAEGPLMTYGYQGEVLIGSVISGATAATTVVLHANWLVCDKICVPEQGDFRLDLPAGKASPSAEAKLFTAADAKLPTASPWLAQITPDGNLTLAGQGLREADVREARFFPDVPGRIVDSAAQDFAQAGDGIRLRLKPTAEFRAGAPLTGVLLLRDGAGRERALHVLAAPVAAKAELLEMVGLALLGGLLLNLMPCVFPILAIKAVGLAGLAGRGRGHAWGHAFAYAVGVLATFASIAFLLLGLRSAGAAAGWGFQFQSPVFVGGMALLLFAIGLNLSGLFAVGGAIGAGQGMAGRGGLVGSFFTGLLTVLVATPCTAPFMAAAVAAGLAGSAPVTLAVFLAMGVGLAAPYVLLAVLPAVGRALPRPGRWMELLRQLLAFPMYAASVWMVWVLSQEAGSAGVLAVGAGLLLVGFAGWVLGLAQATRPGARRGLGVAVASLAALAAVGAMAPLLGDTQPPGISAGEPGIETFSAARLASLRAEGRPVFVNVTAAWCVTCLVNERLALASAEVRKGFAANKVVYLKGDWTRQDPEITRFLREHGREGVPFYALFPAGGGPPIELPQILTESGVLAVLAPG